MIAFVVVLLMTAAALVYVRLFANRQTAAPAGSATGTPSGLPAAGGLPSAATTTAPAAGGGATGPTFVLPTVTRASADEVLQNRLFVAARDFAERYGSYSSDGDFSNLEALLPVMTDSFAASTRRAIDAGRAAQASTGFVGVSTKALSVRAETPIAADSPVTVTVTTQRTTVGGTTPGVSYQDLRIVMSYVGGVWKAASAAWQ